MFFLRKLNHKIDRLILELEKSNLQELIFILGSRKEILKRNFIAGISRGVGIGIGVTIITAILIVVLEKIVTFNIPVIGKYVADIVEIVEKNRY